MFMAGKFSATVVWSAKMLALGKSFDNVIAQFKVLMCAYNADAYFVSRVVWSDTTPIAGPELVALIVVPVVMITKPFLSCVKT